MARSRRRRNNRLSREEDLADLVNTAMRLLEAGQANETIRLLDSALSRHSDRPELIELLGMAKLRGGEIVEGLKLLDRIVELGRATAGTWRHLADGLVAVREYAQALGAFEHSLREEPNHARTRHNYGRTLYRLGDVEGAAAQLTEAIRLEDLEESWLALTTMAPGVPSITANKLRQIRQLAARRLTSLKADEMPRPAGKSPPDRLKVAYLCAFFDRPNYMKPVWALVNHHDRQRFHVHLLTDTEIPHVGGYEPRETDVVCDISSWDNQQLLDQIRAMQIDILVDLNAYSTMERLALFTRRAAPVVMAWFNMYATSGLPYIDYLVGDRYVVHPDEERGYTERMLWLSQSYLSFQVYHTAPDVAPSPCARDGHVTLGSFVTQYKVTPSVLDAWAEILGNAPRSRLVLANADLDSRENRQWLARQFRQRGVDDSRVRMLGSASHFDFLKYYDLIDLALDSFPYNGGTTTMEAIWQGVPVVAYVGDRWASRTSRSILMDAGLAEFVGEDVHDYVAIATRWANDTDALAELPKLRSDLRNRVRHASVYDGEGLARSMENLFDQVWREEVTPSAREDD